MKKLAAFIVTAAAAVLSAPASAQFAKAEDAIKYRQSAFFVMGQHFSRIGAMANVNIFVLFDRFAKGIGGSGSLRSTLSDYRIQPIANCVFVFTHTLSDCANAHTLVFVA